MLHSFLMVKWNPYVYLLTKLPHPYHSRYASSPALPASVTAHSSRSWMIMKGDYNHQKWWKWWFNPWKHVFLPRFAKKWDITWHDVSNKNDDFCRLEIGNLTLFIQEQWWVLLVWISQHWKFTPMLWPYSTDKAYYDKHNTTKRVGQQPMGASNNNIYIYIHTKNQV